MKDYEMVMILDPGLDSTSFEDKTRFLQEKLTNYDGVIQNVTPWGKRKLAYDIEKKDSAYYVVFNFQIPSQGLLDFKESIRHDTEILRYLIVVKHQPMMPMTSTSAEEEKEPVVVKEIDSVEESDNREEDEDKDKVNKEEK